MGFYGNITNTARTQFYFDRKFPNRKAMEEGINTDGVYAGRFVLVEYDENSGFDNWPIVKRVVDENKDAKFYIDGTDTELRIGMAVSDTRLYAGTLVRVRTESTDEHPVDYEFDFYMCTGPDPVPEGQEQPIATFVYDKNSGETNYAINYGIDTEYAKNVLGVGVGRGWDSTVWQKVYVDQEQKYVMIAELNTVVPVYDLVVDAPTMNPLMPHYDVDSTNVYYKLHVQPNWGLRVAKEDNKEKSDAKTIWYDPYSYDPSTGKIIPGEPNPSVDAAIYFNKAAFDPQVGVDPSQIHKRVDDENSISILPTGSSGQKYNKHDGTSYGTETSNDIQEMRVSLPIFGNTISDVYDIMHGQSRDDSPYDSLQGKLDSFNEMENNQIPVALKNEKGECKLVGAEMNGDEWITTTVDAANQEITVTHNKPKSEVAGTYGPGEDQTFKFGEGLTVPSYKVDEAGHVVTTQDRTLTLPKPNLEQEETGNVVVGLSLDQPSGTFTYTLNNVGDLPLTGYSEADSTAPEDGTSINSAIKYLMANGGGGSGGGEDIDQLKKQLAALTNRVSSLETNDSKQDTSITEIKEEIQRLQEEISGGGGGGGTGGDLEQRVATLEDKVAALEAFKQTFEDEGYNERLTALEGNDATQDGNITDLQDRVAKLEGGGGGGGTGSTNTTIWYCSTDTAGSTPTKVVTIKNGEFTEAVNGDLFVIDFAHAHTSDAMGIQVDETHTFPANYLGETIGYNVISSDNMTAIFVYNTRTLSLIGAYPATSIGGRIWAGYSQTEGSIQQKEVNITNQDYFGAKDGDLFCLHFLNDNTAAEPTIKISGELVDHHIVIPELSEGEQEQFIPHLKARREYLFIYVEHTGDYNLIGAPDDSSGGGGAGDITPDTPTTVDGILKGSSGKIAAAVQGTDYIGAVEGTGESASIKNLNANVFSLGIKTPSVSVPNIINFVPGDNKAASGTRLALFGSGQDDHVLIDGVQTPTVETILTDNTKYQAINVDYYEKRTPTLVATAIENAASSSSGTLYQNLVQIINKVAAPKPHGVTITLSTSGWSASSDTFTQTASNSSVTADGIIFVSPAPESWENYATYGLRMTAQAAGKATFVASTRPEAEIKVNLVIF